MVKKSMKSPPPIVYLALILAIGYGGYRFFTKSELKSNFNKPKELREYDRVENALRNQEWRQADFLTWGILKELADDNKSGWLNQKEIENLPCPDLLKIDQLWRGYSGDRFGFSIQKDIYQNLGGGYDANFDIRAYRTFAFQVGWVNPQTTKQREGYYFYKDLKFKLDQAPRGHLPAFSATWISYDSSEQGFVALAERLNICLVR